MSFLKESLFSAQSRLLAALDETAPRVSSGAAGGQPREGPAGGRGAALGAQLPLHHAANEAG